MRRILSAIAVLVVLLTPALAHAAAVEFPLVPCGIGSQPVCTPCDLCEVTSRVINLILFGITGPIAAFMIVLAGGMMLLGGANPGNYSTGKKWLTNTLTGVTVILLAWVMTNFLIKSIAPTGNDRGPWYEFQCPQYLQEIEPEKEEVAPGAPAGLPLPPPAPATPPTAADVEVVPGVKVSSLYASLAQSNKVPFPARSSGALTALMDCLYQDPIVAAMTFPKPPNGGTQSGNFTYENDNMSCNYTRGRPVGGGRCAHGGSRGISCHYGGKTGTDGAEAVDMNALMTTVTIPGQVDANGQPKKVQANEENLFCELYRVLVTEKKCPFKLLNFEKDHTHISTTTCDADGRGGASSQLGGLPPKACPSALQPSTSAAPATP